MNSLLLVHMFSRWLQNFPKKADWTNERSHAMTKKLSENKKRRKKFGRDKAKTGYVCSAIQLVQDVTGRRKMKKFTKLLRPRGAFEAPCKNALLYTKCCTSSDWWIFQWRYLLFWTFYGKDRVGRIMRKI